MNIIAGGKRVRAERTSAAPGIVREMIPTLKGSHMQA